MLARAERDLLRSRRNESRVRRRERGYGSAVPGGESNTSLTGVARWVKDFGAIALTLLVALTYLALRIPTTVFLGRLGTSPEEIGVGYTDLILRSSAGVLVAIVAVLVVFVALTALVLPVMVGRSVTDLLLKLRATKPVVEMTDEEYAEYEAHLDRLFDEDPRFRDLTLYLGLDRATTATRDRRRRQLRIAKKTRSLTSEEAAELVALSKAPVSAVAVVGGAFRFYGRRFEESAVLVWRRSLVVALVVVAFLALPLFAYVESQGVRGGDRPTMVAAQLFGYRAEPVKIAPTETQPPAEVTRIAGLGKLMLLGVHHGVTVLYDADAHVTLRVPSGSIVVVGRR